jgi:ATP-dependent Lhr-like helicase
MKSDDLLAAVFPQALACQENNTGEIVIPDHPLVRETMKDALTEAMDIQGLKKLLSSIGAGDIRCLAVDTPAPSQFSHEILNANPYAYLDDAPLEERRARAVGMRRSLPESVLSEIGRLDPNAIAEVREEAWPDVRSADELHDVLQDFVALPETVREALPFVPAGTIVAWADYFAALALGNRATRAHWGDRTYWVAAEKAKQFVAMFPDSSFDTNLPEINAGAFSREDVLTSCVTGWLSHIGPGTTSALAELLALSTGDVDRTLLCLEASGSILRGQFTMASRDQIEWCDRRLLARIHRLTVGTLRKQIQPVNAAQFMHWLLHWQHVAPGTQLLGERGTLEALQQLQGFEAPANAWEDRILAKRIANYDGKTLDQLCLTGAVGWGRLSAHPSIGDGTGSNVSARAPRRVVPSSVAPITFFIREDSDWMTANPKKATRLPTVYPGALAKYWLICACAGLHFLPTSCAALGC